MNTNPLKTAFDKVLIAAERRQIVRGYIGRTSTDTPAQCVVTGQPTFLYVRVGSGDTLTPNKARNRGGVAVRADTPIEMRRINGELVILGYDTSPLFDAATGGDTLNQYGVAPHTHKINTGLEYEIESERMEPGRVHSDSSDMTATLNGFRHALGTFATEDVDLTSFVPSSGYHCWVLLGVDPVANAAVAVSSTPVVTATTLLVTDLDGIDFTGYIPLGAFQVADTTTALATYATDARVWFDTPGAPDTVEAMIVFDDEFVFFDDEVVTG